MSNVPLPSVPKPPVIVIVGPTASGKSAAAMDLAQRFPIEIVNADSRAFYRGMDIGTAKPTPEARARVVHHLIDILGPNEPMSLATFQDLTFDAIMAIHGRHHLPVLVGGTPQYVNAVVENWSIPRIPPNHELRMMLERQARENGVAPLLERLHAVDPVAADRIGPNPRRIIRALEVFEATGAPITALQGVRPSSYDVLEIELFLDRDRLYDRIDRRVDAMIAAGLVDELGALLASGVRPDAPALSAIGYRQLLPFLRGETGWNETVERIKFDTHRLVRSQQTWFRRNSRMIRVDVGEPGHVERIACLIERHLAGWRCSIGVGEQ